MNKLTKAVKEALKLDATILIQESKLTLHPGFTEEYLELLGLSRSYLKKLERHKLAIRGYTDVNPEGKQGLKGPQHRVRWLLIARGAENEEVQTGNQSKEIQAQMPKVPVITT